MSDFETMPIGTRATMRDASALFRSIQAVHDARLNRAIRDGRSGKAHAHKASVCAGIAQRLEALHTQPGVTAEEKRRVCARCVEPLAPGVDRCPVCGGGPERVTP